MLMLDLFSGLGGASRAMRERGWDVITVDNDPAFRPSVVADLTDWSYSGPVPDLVWASPPCIEFSKWSMPASWRCNAGGKVPPDLTLMQATKRIIDEILPRWWVVENVRGAVPFFTECFGPARKVIGSRYLWGYFPPFYCPSIYGKSALFPVPGVDRSACRSLIPREISVALAAAVEAWSAPRCPDPDWWPPSS